MDMLVSWLRKKLGKLSGNRRQGRSHLSSHKSSFRRTLTLLEDRVVPAAFFVDPNAGTDVVGGFLTVVQAANSLTGQAQTTPATLATAAPGSDANRTESGELTDPISAGHGS